ncbi:MAG: hypothetical protein WBP12_02365 [Candidatus Saccharimonas sp.]
MQRLRSRTQPLTDIDHEQELDHEHRKVTDKKHLGINAWWIDEVLDAIRCRILQYQPLSAGDVALLERLKLSIADVLKHGLADWERELLEAGGSDAETKVVAMPERNPFRTARRRYGSIPVAPSKPAGFTPRKMDLDDYRELARNCGYRNGRVRLIG